MQARKIINVKKIGKIRTMDIEVDNESHIFYGNGIATSNSHGVAYAINAFWSAYCKYHKPTAFYISYLNHAHRKPDSHKEIKELVVDAKLLDIEVYPPRLGNIYKDFTSRGGKIYFGISHIKNVGDSECDKIVNNFSNSEIKNFSWVQSLVEIIYKGKVNKRAVISLISVGAFNGPKNIESRNKMLYEFDSWNQLTQREKDYIADNYSEFSSLNECIDNMLSNFKLTSKRKEVVLDICESLKNPFYDTQDSISTIAQYEEKYMGCSLTCSKSDAVDSAFSATMCKDISNGLITGKANIIVTISSVRTYKTKKGKNPGQIMAFLCAEDSSGMLDSITVFPESYENYKDLLIENNTVLIQGEISKRDKSSIIANKITQV